MSKDKQESESLNGLNIEDSNINSEETKKLFHDYGIDIPIDVLNNGDIEILEINKDYIRFHDHRTNEIVILSLYNSSVTNLETYNITQNFFTGYYHVINSCQDSDQSRENIVATKQNNHSQKLAYAYANVNTKYGPLCLNITEQAPYLDISILYGHHNTKFNHEPKTFNYIRDGFFHWKYNMLNKTDCLFLGPYSDSFHNQEPRLSIYNHTALSPNQDTSTIYVYEAMADNCSSVIFMDGKQKMEEASLAVPNIQNFQHFWIPSKLEQFEKEDWISKMYFWNFDSCLVILKQNKRIIIKQIKASLDDFAYTNVTEEILGVLDSKTITSFTYDDFKLIIEYLTSLSITYQLHLFTIEVLKSYINTHDKIMFNTKSPFTLEDTNFDNILTYLKKYDISQLVEQIIDNVINTFDISITTLGLSNQTDTIANKPKQYEKKQNN